MGPFLFPVLAFVLWEFPSMVMMSLHKAVCALTGGSFQAQYLGSWTYRLAGMFLYWPAVMIMVGMAVGTGTGAVAGIGQFLLASTAITTVVLLFWARLSSRGS